MMKTIIVILLMFLTPLAFSQDEWWNKKSDSTHQESKERTRSTIEPEGHLSRVSTLDTTNFNDTNKYKEPEVFQPGDITVVKSPLIEKVIKFKSATIPPYSGPVMDGFRIQLFFDQSRKEVDKARSIILGIDSNTPTYIEYKAPNYFLLQGNYRTELEAEKIRASMISEFPAAIVVKDKIYLPKIKEGEENKSTD